jgi:putative ABC transport system ATP-binding protein
MSHLLAGRNLHKAYGRTAALDGAAIAVAAGEVVAVTGPSGSGKSTLLLTLAGIVRPQAGEVTYDGQRLDRLPDQAVSLIRLRDFGLVLQFGHLVPELTALQNVALPLLLDGHRRAAAEAAAAQWLERLDVEGVAAALPGEMSGGEMQRVAIARALVHGPRVIFADEPTGALDSVSGDRVLATLVRTARESGATLVIVTHDNVVAASADREVVLRDGRVAELPVVAP